MFDRETARFLVADREGKTTQTRPRDKIAHRAPPAWSAPNTTKVCSRSLGRKHTGYSCNHPLIPSPQVASPHGVFVLFPTPGYQPGDRTSGTSMSTLRSWTGKFSDVLRRISSIVNALGWSEPATRRHAYQENPFSFSSGRGKIQRGNVILGGGEQPVPVKWR